eukprot:scaffold23747_cov58-Phaeocystis_antarctica.AAC.1
MPKVGWLWDNWNQAHPPPSLLGTVGRKLDKNDKYVLPRHKGQEPIFNKANFVLPPYMISAALMNAYSAPPLLPARRYVDEQTAHCDDILLNEMAWSERLVVTRLTWGFGFWANKSANITSSGLSKKRNRAAARFRRRTGVYDSAKNKWRVLEQTMPAAGGVCFAEGKCIIVLGGTGTRETGQVTLPPPAQLAQQQPQGRHGQTAARACALGLAFEFGAPDTDQSWSLNSIRRPTSGHRSRPPPSCIGVTHAVPRWRAPLRVQP